MRERGDMAAVLWLRKALAQEHDPEVRAAIAAALRRMEICAEEALALAASLRTQYKALLFDEWGSAPDQFLAVGTAGESGGGGGGGGDSLNPKPNLDLNPKPNLDLNPKPNLDATWVPTLYRKWEIPADAVPPSIRSSVWPLAPLYPQVQTRNPKPETRNPRPETRNPKL
jgi:hypothetical protein